MNWNVLVATTLALISIMQSAAASTVSFKPPQTYRVSANPISLAVGDFNGDGKPDLAVLSDGDTAVNGTSSGNGSVSILLGNGDGTFQSARSFTVPTNLSGIAAGDFNEDGRDDLAVLRFASATNTADQGDITIFLSNGDGTFRVANILTPGTNPEGALVYDFNGDHKLDVATTDGGPDGTVRVSVLLGNGDGSFQPASNYKAGGNIALGDFNSDGKIDLAVGGSPGILILMGNGDGTFQPGIAAASYPQLLGVADFNGDGKADLLARGTNPCPPRVCFGPVGIFLGNEDGTFRGPIGVASQFVGVAGDLNGDGKVDLAGFTLTGDGHAVVVLLGNGDGTFQAPATFAAGVEPVVGAVIDLNGDKEPDLVTVDFATASPGGNGDVSVLLNNTGSDFSISATTLSSSLGPGQSTTSTISLNLLSSFKNPVSLACSVQPTQAGAPTCSLSADSVTFDGNGKASATLTINAGSSVASSNSFLSLSKAGWLWFPLAGFAFFGTGARFWRKRRVQVVLVGASLLAGMIVQLACGGGNSGATTGLKSTAYTVMVTASSGTTQHSATVDVIAQ